MILGPPGTGKTTTLLSILEKELMQVDPTRIAYVSYTRKGAYEGRDRARRTMKLRAKDLPYFRTLHSIAYRSAGISTGGMLEDNKVLMKKFSDKMGMKFSGYYTEDFSHNDDRYLFFDFLHRNNPKTAVEYMKDMNIDMLRWVRRNYFRFKETVGLPDYTDLIELYCKKNESLPVDIAIIDEAQDLTTLQWTMIWIAFRNCKRVYIAGDDDQAIYEWSGADVDYFLHIKAEQEILSKSYRLPDSIHEYSERITSYIQDRIPKDYASNGTKGELHRILDFREVDIDNGEEWLFLSRNNYFLDEIEEWLKDKGKVFYRKGKSSINPSIYKAIKKHSIACHNGGDISVQDHQMVSFFCKSSPTYTKPWYEEFNKLLPETIKYFRRIIGAKENLEGSRININTIHGVKGGEADNVVLILDINKRVNENMQIHHDAEMRCYYVGVTRAKKSLYLVSPKTKYSFPIM